MSGMSRADKSSSSASVIDPVADWVPGVIVRDCMETERSKES